MEDYIVTPEYETLEDVAKDEMSVIMSPDSVEIMLPYLDLEGYGRALVNELNADLTAYGNRKYGDCNRRACVLFIALCLG